MNNLMNFLRFITLIVILLSCYDCVLLPPTQQAEQTLIASLLSGYNKDIRPKDQVSVEITAALQQIVSLDEKQQIMTSSSFISQKWLDERLSWTPNSTNNYLTVVMLLVTDLWTPDLMIVNSADADGYLTVSDFSLASVNNHGQVYMLLPALVVKTRCPLFLQKFPFDRQVCTINLTTWGQGANRIVLTKKNDAVVDISQYSEHPIWQLNGTSMVEVHSGDRSPFEDTYNSIISVELYLKRKPLFFMMNGIFACLILNCVTLLSYALPFGSQIGLCMTCFMTYSVYSLNFSNLFPQQSDYLMLITLYFLLSMVWTLLSMVWFMTCNHYMSKGQLPKPLFAFGELLERVYVCCFSSPSSSEDEKAVITEGTSIVQSASCQSCFSTCVFRRSPKVQNAAHNGSEVSAPKEAVSIPVNLSVEQTKPKCNICDRCEPCQTDFQDEKAKRKAKKDVESKCSALNYFVFLCIFTFMLAANVPLWLSMAS